MRFELLDHDPAAGKAVFEDGERAIANAVVFEALTTAATQGNNQLVPNDPMVDVARMLLANQDPSLSFGLKANPRHFDALADAVAAHVKAIPSAQVSIASGFIEQLRLAALALQQNMGMVALSEQTIDKIAAGVEIPDNPEGF